MFCYSNHAKWFLVFYYFSNQWTKSSRQKKNKRNIKKSHNSAKKLKCVSVKTKNKITKIKMDRHEHLELKMYLHRYYWGLIVNLPAQMVRVTARSSWSRLKVTVVAAYNPKESVKKDTLLSQFIGEKLTFIFGIKILVFIF